MDNLAPVTPSPSPTGVRAVTIATPQRSTSPDGHAHPTLAALWHSYGAEPVELVRTREGRDLSRTRYRRAEEFMLGLDPGAPGDWPDFLYAAGIVTQLALSSHLLDVGFPDAWCARHVSLHVARSLAYANATGWGYDCPETARLTNVLSPYWKWNHLHLVDGSHPDDGGFSAGDVRRLLHGLMDHVRQVTGHGPLRRRVRQA